MVSFNSRSWNIIVALIVLFYALFSDVSPTPCDSSSDESVPSERTTFMSMLTSREIVVDSDDEDKFARMFADRAAVSFGESP